MVLVYEGQRGVGTGEAMVVHFAVNVARIFRRDERHVTIGTFLGRFGVIEGQRPLMRNAARLPLVIIIKTAKPTEVVDRLIQMHLVAGGTEFGGALAMEGFQETLPMRFRIQSDKIVMELAY